MKQKNISTGVQFGLILGLIYCVLLFWRWSNVSNLFMIGMTSLLGYLIIIGLLFWEAAARKKAEGGFIDIKNLFQTLFISVLIFELFYSVYNYIHFSYIDTHIVDKMKAALNAAFEKAGNQFSEDRKTEALSNLDQYNNYANILKIIRGYFISVAVSGIIAILVALIMRKNRPEFEEHTQ